MENVNTNLEEIFKTLFPTDGLEPEGFCINSRDLHKAMGVGKMYANWIKGRIAKHNFEEGYDYIIVQNLRLPDLAIANSRAQIANDYMVMITKLVPTRIGVITVARVTTKGLDHLRHKLT